MRRGADSGFTLIEAVIAAGVLAVALVSLAQLLVIATQVTMAAGTLTTATVMAQQKVEELEAGAWDGPALAPSPPGTLDEDTSGYVEYLAADGRILDSAGSPPSAVFVRRWSVAAVSDSARAIEVRVRRSRLNASPGDRIGECRLTFVRTRRTP